MFTRNNRALLTLLISCSVATLSCATFNPRPIDEVHFRDRAQRRCEDNVCVTAAVLTAEESEAIFSVPLYNKGIQAVWLEIENKDKEQVWFLPVGVDPDYFSPFEVGYMYRSTFSKSANEKMDQYLHDHAIRGCIAPGSVRSGFVFTNLDMGIKAFNVDLVGEDHRLRIFSFFIALPGLRLSHQDVVWNALYKEKEIVSYDNEEELRRGLENLPCCATNRDGTKQAKPLNLVIIGGGNFLYHNLIRRGWDETESPESGFTSETQRSSTFPEVYRYAPVSPLYLYGRHQDAAFRKSRLRADERNEMRLWLSPIRYKGKPVWVGQLSRNIKVRYLQNTFRIEPLVDEARTYILQDFWFSQGLEKFGYVKGVGPASMSEPRADLEGNPYFTDGYRVVLWLSTRPVAFSDVEAVDWEIPFGVSTENERVNRQ